MNIVYITQYLPYPLTGGGKIKTLSTLKTLQKQKHRVILFSFVTKKDEIKYEKHLKKMGFYIGKTLYNPYITDTLPKIHKVILFIKSLFTLKPFTVSKYYMSRMETAIKQILATHETDCIWIDQLIMAQYLPENFAGLKILETHNVDSLFFKKMMLTDYSFPNRIFAFFEWLKFRVYEKTVFPRFTKIYAISKTDQILEKLSGRHKVEILKPVILTKIKSPKTLNSKTLLFIGSLKWYPNKDGIVWFLNNVVSQIKDFKNFRVNIIGKCPKDLVSYQKIYLNIRFRGFINNPAEYWQKAGIFIAPIRYGTGIRIKILEAMSYGLPVVATQQSVTGLDISNGCEVLIAKDENEFAQKINLLSENQTLRKKLAENGLKFLKLNYSETRIAL